MMKNPSPLMLMLFLISASTAWGQASPFPDSNVQTAYQRLLPQIEQVRIFDNHGHLGFPDDADVDAMAIPPDSSVPFRLRDENAELLDAAKALFDYPYSDLSPVHLRWLIDKKAEAKRRLGANYFLRVLDQVGIETAVANRVSMPPYLDPSRFRWVVFVDSFLFPFDSQQMESRDAAQKLNLPLQRNLLRRELAQAHLEQLPADFHGYLEFIRNCLETSMDSSLMGIFLYPDELKHVLKQWLELFPDKNRIWLGCFSSRRRDGRRRKLLAGGSVGENRACCRLWK